MKYSGQTWSMIAALVSCIFLTFSLALPAKAAEDAAPLLRMDLRQVDQNAVGRLSMHYPTLAADSVSIPAGVQAYAYRIAQMREGYPADPAMARYTAAIGWDQAVAQATHSAAPVDWAGLANALTSYIQSDNVTANAVANIDSNYTATFNNLPVGVYLILTPAFTFNNFTYTFIPSLVAVPTVSQGKISYNVVAEAKGAKTPKPAEPVEYKIIKQWDDNSAHNARPKQILVEILRDGTPFTTVTLSAENGWNYRWSDSAGHVWTVSEKLESLAGTPYVVSNSKIGNTFILTNTDNTPPPNKPRPKLSTTGGQMSHWWIAPVIILAGITLLVGIKIKGKRSVKNEADNRG